MDHIAINNGSHMQAETEWIQIQLVTQAWSLSKYIWNSVNTCTSQETKCVHCKDRLFNIVYGNVRCLFWGSHSTYITIHSSGIMKSFRTSEPLIHIITAVFLKVNVFAMMNKITISLIQYIMSLVRDLYHWSPDYVTEVLTTRSWYSLVTRT
jgi:hypothetical protein